MARFRLPLTAVLLAAAFLTRSTRAADHKAPPAKPAAEYAAFDAHPNEHVTIAAEPCDDAKDCAFFRLNYLAHGMLPVRVVITNDSDTALSLDDARMQFLSADGGKFPAATDDDLNRRLFTMRFTQPIKIPLIPIPIKRTPIDKKITEDEADTGFPGTVVNAHSTLSGFLFYDVHGLDDPALKHAELYLKQIHTLDGKRELFAFTIRFDKWLAANPATPSNQSRK